MVVNNINYLIPPPQKKNPIVFPNFKKIWHFETFLRILSKKIYMMKNLTCNCTVTGNFEAHSYVYPTPKTLS